MRNRPAGAEFGGHLAGVVRGGRYVYVASRLAALRGGNEGVGISKAGLVTGGTASLKTTRAFGRDGTG